jgi:hypothetical protein
MGFERINLFEGVLLASCSVFGGVLFGALIGITGAFRNEAAPAATQAAAAVGAPRVA